MVQGFKPSVAPPGNPLRRFRGKLDGYTSEENTYGDRKTLDINFNFTELEVLEADEPYPYPVTTIQIRYTTPNTQRSRRTQSGQGNRWEVFANSLRKVFPPGEADIDKLVGKVQEWAMLPSTIRSAIYDEDGNPVYEIGQDGQTVTDQQGQPRQKWGDVETDCWQVTEVAGIGSVKEMDASFDQHLDSLADGKTEADFYEAALTDQQVMSRPAIVTAITDRKFVATMLESGRWVRDDEGVLHVATGVAEPASS